MKLKTDPGILLSVLFLILTVLSLSQNIDTLPSWIKNTDARADDSVKVENYYHIAFRLRINYPDSAIYFYRKGAAIAQRIGNKNLLGNGYLDQSNLFAEHGEFKKAMAYCDSAYNIYMEVKKRPLPDLLRLRANIFLSIGEYDSAAANYFLAIRQYNFDSLSTGLLSTYHNLAELFNTINDHQQALFYSLRQYKIATLAKEDDETAWAAVNVCESYNGLQQSDKAKPYALQLYELSKKMDDPYLMAYARQEMGTFYFNAHDYVKAVAFYEDALKNCENLFEKLSVCKLLLSVSNAHFQLKHYDQTKKYLKRAELLCKGITARPQLQQVYELLSKNAAAQHYYEGAYKYLLLNKSLSDSLLSEKSITTLQKLNTEFDTEKKQKSIALLSAQNKATQIELQKNKATRNELITLVLLVIIIAGLIFYNFKSKIRRKNEIERARISRDLHDDVGATLSSISIFSEAANQKLKIKNTDDASALIQRISNDAQEMVSVMSDMVWTLNPANDPFQKMIDRMQSYASAVLSAKNIKMNFETDESLNSVLLKPEIRKNIFLIFKEAINNAAKYSESSEVAVRLKSLNGRLMMQISDNGKGFNNSNSQSGGNGILNMKERAEEINAEFVIDSTQGGITITVNCPL